MITPFLSTPLDEKSEKTDHVNISSEDMGERAGNPDEASPATCSVSVKALEVFEPGLSQNPRGQFSSLSGKHRPSQTSP